MPDNLTGEYRIAAANQEWVVVFTMPSLIRLEDKLGKGSLQIAGELARTSRYGLLRDVLWAGLIEKHGELDPGDVALMMAERIEEVGPEAFSLELITAYAASFPRKADAGAAEGAGNPRRRPRRTGTGPSSTASGAS